VDHRVREILKPKILRDTCCIGNYCKSFEISSLVLIVSIFLASHYPAAASSAVQEASVLAVNDGDTVTLKISDKEYRTRLIGIDGPEMGQEPWGRKSREHLRRLLKDLRWQVLVETDVVSYDKYNRLLVYLWSQNNNLINEQMLLDGYAVLFTIQPNSKYADRFKKAQRAAREKKIGIWGRDGLKERPLDYKKRNPRQPAFRHFNHLPLRLYSQAPFFVTSI
jgi:micrococcal nuclease